MENNSKTSFERLKEFFPTSSESYEHGGMRIFMFTDDETKREYTLYRGRVSSELSKEEIVKLGEDKWAVDMAFVEKVVKRLGGKNVRVFWEDGRRTPSITFDYQGLKRAMRIAPFELGNEGLKKGGGAYNKEWKMEVFINNMRNDEVLGFSDGEEGEKARKDLKKALGDAGATNIVVGVQESTDEVDGYEGVFFDYEGDSYRSINKDKLMSEVYSDEPFDDFEYIFDGEKVGKVLATTDDSWVDFFGKNPSNNLGTTKEVKGKFGMTTITEGKEGALDKIETPDYRTIEGTNPFQSEEGEDVNENTLTPEELESGKKELQSSKNVLADILIAEESGVDLDLELWDFDKVDEDYNEGISFDDKTAYIYYLENLSQKEVKGGFSKYRVSQNEKNAKMLMEKGVLFYDTSEKDENRRYQPRFLYISGNIYDKVASLEKDKQFYLDKFGESIFAKHEEAIAESYKEVWEKRLSLDNPELNMRMTLKISGEIASSYMIKDMITPDNEVVNSFRVFTGEAKGEEYINPIKEGNYSKMDAKGALSLRDAFPYWLKLGGHPSMSKDKGIIYRGGQNYVEIYEWFVKGGSVGMSDMNKDVKQIKKEQAKNNGERLFSQFLAQGLTTAERRKLELTWNRQYNGNLVYEPNDVPIGFQFSKFFTNSDGALEINDIREEKREALGFAMMRGSSMLAYGVGIGKTYCSIFILAQNLELGLCKRPLVIVPNAVYSQFRKTILEVLPQYKLNNLYNCRGVYESVAKNITDYSISICTYEGMERMGFSENVDEGFTASVSSILENGNNDLTERQQAKLQERYEEMLGIGKKGGAILFDTPSVDFDYIVCDEAHNMKKLFTSVKGQPSEEQGEGQIKRKKSGYSINAGEPTARAIKLFFLTQYVQDKTPNGNILLLTATPFTNSGLEVYTMLTYINSNYLEKLGFGNIVNFYDTFAKIKVDDVLNSKDEYVSKSVFVGWNNILALQNLISKFIDKKGKEDEDKLVTRPNKIVLPLNNVMVDGVVIALADKNQISTTISASEEQKELFAELNQFASGQISLDDLAEKGENSSNIFSGGLKKEKKKKKEDNPEDDTVVVNLNSAPSEAMTSEQRERLAKAKVMVALAYKRAVTLSPYLYKFNGTQHQITASTYVESSPKLLYVFECIKLVKEYHVKNKTPMSGQVVYINLGKDAFPLLLQYAVEELGFEEHEVGMITGGVNRIGRKAYKGKSQIQDAFLGQRWVEESLEFEPIAESKRLKILFGTQAIKEGLNLQTHASVLYNCYLDWNPTDNIQLEGRIWRQGNKFSNVRIVVPLIGGSSDIFLFQKLQEKTGRINQLWQKDGLTNEISTADFDAKELKYEMITDPMTLAELSVKDRQREIEAKMDEVNYDFNTFNSFLAEYKEKDSYFPLVTSRLPLSKYAHLYYFLQTFRPDLVPEHIIKEKYLTNTSWIDKIVDGMDMDFDKKALSYTLEELVDKMVQMNKDKKIAFPPSYTADWEEATKPKLPIMVGDEVEFDTKKGRKKGVVSVAYDMVHGEDLADNYSPEQLLSAYKVHDNNPNYISHGQLPLSVDIMVGDNEVEDVGISNKNVVRIEKKKKKKKKEKLEPFNYGTQQAIDNIVDISKFQLQQNQKKKGTASLGSSRLQLSDLEGMRELTPNEVGVQGSIASVLRIPPGRVDGLRDWLEENKKWVDVLDRFKNLGTLYGSGYNTHSYGEKFWTTETPLMIKKLQKGEETFLKPKGINNQKELIEKTEELKAEISTLTQDIKDLTDIENLREIAKQIEHKILEDAEKGIHKSAGYKKRAKDFASSNADYLGNKYLGLMAKKKIGKKVEVEEAIIVEEKVEVKANALDSLKKRLKGITMLIRLEQDKAKLASLKKRKKGFQLLIKIGR